VHVIDASKPPDEQWRTIDAELAAYGAGLDRMPQIVVLNKIDLEPEPELGIADERIVDVFPVSCATGEGIDTFRTALFDLVPEPERRAEVDDVLPEFLVYRPTPQVRRWSLLRTEGGFRVLGSPPSEEELERALKEAGARRGASVEVGEESFEYVP
jgi:GTP-binding protein